MALLGYNGGLRGKPRTPSTSNASGIWDLEEQKIAASAGIWPSAGGDPYWANVSLLLHMNGSNGSTTFTDSSSNAFSVTANGNAQISTAQSKFDGSSGLFDGSGDCLTIPYNSAFDFGTGAFTVEGQFFLNTVSGNQMIYSRSSASSLVLRETALYLTSATNINFYSGVRGASLDIRTFLLPVTLATGSWYHFAFTRNDAAGAMRLFIDGVPSVNIYYDTTNLDGPLPLAIGALNGFVGTPDESAFNGHLAEFRVTKGIARYTSDFTPPTALFPNF
jgi:hypothetical protein